MKYATKEDVRRWGFAIVIFIALVNSLLAWTLISEQQRQLEGFKTAMADLVRKSAR